MVTKNQIERAANLIGKTILLDDCDTPELLFCKTLKVHTVGKVPRHMVTDVWSWPEKEEYFCLIGEFMYVQNGEIMDHNLRSIVYKDKFAYETIQNQKEAWPIIGNKYKFGERID